MREKGGWVFLLPCLAGIGALFVLPLLISVFLSFRSGSSFCGLSHYRELFASKAFLLAGGNTLKLMAVGIPLLLLLAMVNAMGIRFLDAHRIPGRRAVFLLELLPMILPSFILVQLVKMFFGEQGLVNRGLTALGLPAVVFDRGPYVFWLFVGLYLWKNVGYAMVVFLAGMQGIPESVREAAMLDGAGSFRLARYVTLPLLLPSLLFNVIIAVMNVFHMFRESYLLYGSYPDRSIYFIQNYMNNHFYAFNYAQLAAASVVFFLVLALGLALLIRCIGRRNEIW